MMLPALRVRQSDGYCYRVFAGRMKYEHVRIAECAIGGPLPQGAEVHHWDENPANNSPSNLVVCPDREYHKLIHRRMRAMDACGNPNWRCCGHCKQWDDPANLVEQKLAKKDKTGRTFHAACRAAYMRSRYVPVNQRK